MALQGQKTDTVLITFTGKLRWRLSQGGRPVLQQEKQLDYWGGPRGVMGHAGKETQWVDVPTVTDEEVAAEEAAAEETKGDMA